MARSAGTRAGSRRRSTGDAGTTIAIVVSALGFTCLFFLFVCLCIRARERQTAEEQQCPEGHALTRCQSDETRPCYACCEPISAGESSMSCPTCGIDICAKCCPQGEVEAPSSSTLAQSSSAPVATDEENPVQVNADRSPPADEVIEDKE